MKNTTLALAMILLLCAAPLFATTPEMEKAFCADFTKAFEARDKDALLSFIYRENADETALSFLWMKMVDATGSKKYETKINSLEFAEFTADEAKNLEVNRQLPQGGYGVFNLKPAKKLVVSYTSNGHAGKFTVWVAEKDGKIVLPTLAPVQ